MKFESAFLKRFCNFTTKFYDFLPYVRFQQEVIHHRSFILPSTTIPQRGLTHSAIHYYLIL